MRLLDSAGSRGTFMSRLGRKHFSGSFASSGFASSLLGASHVVCAMILCVAMAKTISIMLIIIITTDAAQ
jgi:hypothetical protein